MVGRKRCNLKAWLLGFAFPGGRLESGLKLHGKFQSKDAGFGKYFDFQDSFESKKFINAVIGAQFSFELPLEPLRTERQILAQCALGGNSRNVYSIYLTQFACLCIWH